MKKVIIILVCFLAILFACCTKYQNEKIIAVSPKKQPKIELQETIIESQEPTEENEWNLFLQAIIWVESRGNEKAVGKGDCVGILQLTKIYVNEANRLLGFKKYSYDDRFDSLKSIEMFTLIQYVYNPEKDINKAMFYHNKKAGIEYKNKILDRIKFLKNNK